jgi:cytochrome d ubiquinol oxidase subunit I
MVGVGLLMIAIGLFGAFLWLRGQLFTTSWYLRSLTYAWPLGFIAIVAGWWVTETGRQPYLVYGVLRTADAVSNVAASAVLTSLILFVLVYSSVFSMGILFINRLIEKGPEGKAVEGPDALPSRPISAAQGAARDAMNQGARP